MADVPTWIGALALVVIAILLAARLADARAQRRDRVVARTVKALAPLREEAFVRHRVRARALGTPLPPDVDAEGRASVNVVWAQYDALGRLARDGHLDAALVRAHAARPAAESWRQVEPLAMRRREAEGADVGAGYEWLARQEP